MKTKSFSLSMCGLALLPAAAVAQGLPSYNLYGSPGLIDMPTAFAAPDATLSATLSNFGDNSRATLNFQITPRLSGSFRYSEIRNYDTVASINGKYYDRSFDLRYQLLTEGRYRPAVTVGFQDFIGTGLFSGEYVVASKNVTKGLQLTGGLGWGRLGSNNPIASTGVRPVEIIGRGGVPTYDRWFRGDVAAFGGLSYAFNDRLRFKLEYSSDSYLEESITGRFEKKSPWNYGVDYNFRNGTQLSLYYAYGNEIGAQITVTTNPKKAAVPGSLDSAPEPVAPRDMSSVNDLNWTTDTTTVTSARTTLAKAMEDDGIKIEGLKLEPRRATIRIRNERYIAVSQAIGRTARAMTRSLPASISEFVIIPTENGIPMSAIAMNRGDVEALENSAATEILARTQIVDAFGKAPAVDEDVYPRFTYSFAPYVETGFFDPDQPVRYGTGLRLRGSAKLTKNFVLDGAITKMVGGTLDEITRDGAGTSTLPRVRTEYSQYAKETDIAIENLTATHYGRPGKDLYSRVTVGYLESMYAGVSTEVLWKPVDSRLALGVELNYVQKREYDQLFGLLDYTVATGHASAYYSLGNGFHGQVDVGRYLAGDYGATFRIDREFGNGWRVGAYATFTDVSYEDFGEGSFDKGIRVTIPIGWALSNSSRQRNTFDIKSLTRDGGAQLNVKGRLYEQVRSNHEPELAKTWGRFWR
ncbi:YjbH domain-containing protein [Puniceibacterium sp. IMCC21224]|uniref:YjbH domain-containing protein n=1 Tax=Puniceibacterium sp. IMCC21224 TaxID=1618204 RepID=UPI001E43F17E|nr:YjbH domain-containing protein [Puniceibacterium sp. IMCC21224]